MIQTTAALLIIGLLKFRHPFQVSILPSAPLHYLAPTRL